MNKKSDIIKRVNAMDVGSSGYHFALAEWFQLMSDESKDPEVKSNYLECCGLHKLMGEMFKNE